VNSQVRRPALAGSTSGDARGRATTLGGFILERIKGKLGFAKALEALGVSRVALHNYLVRRLMLQGGLRLSHAIHLIETSGRTR